MIRLRCAARVFTLALWGSVLSWPCSWDYLIWSPRSKSADPLYRFVKDGKAGYIDQTGKVLIEPKFRAFGNSGGEFHDGLLEISVYDGIYADRTGKTVVDKGLYRGWDFSEGLAVAMRKGENLWGYIDTSGAFAIPPQYPAHPAGYVSPFSDGLAKVQVRGKVGYIDKTGKIVINMQFLDGMAFSDGMAAVVTEGPCLYFPDGPCGIMNPKYAGGEIANAPSCKFGYIDKGGVVAIPAQFDSARAFSEGLAPVRIGERWGFVDKTGAIAIEPQFDDAEPFSSGLACVRAKDRWGYIDRAGAFRVEPRYRFAEDFSEGFAVVGNESGYWYIDASGKTRIAGPFEAAGPFFHGLAHVRYRGKKFAYLDQQGRTVFSY